MIPLLTFLLIDDDEDDRELFQIALDELENPVEYTGCDNCSKALEMLENSGTLPDYIFLDLNMPQMGGKQCLAKLKENARLLHIPVVIFSTSADPRDVEETRKLGAIDFITKPSRTSELTKILENFINAHHESALKK